MSSTRLRLGLGFLGISMVALLAIPYVNADKPEPAPIVTSAKPAKLRAVTEEPHILYGHGAMMYVSLE